MELTVTFNELLRARQAPPTRQALSLSTIDSFLQTASSINREIASLHHELSSIRQAYLSTAAPRKTRLQRSSTGKDSLHSTSPTAPKYLTDADRDVIDREAKDLLRTLSARIQILTQEEIRRQGAAATAIQQKFDRGGLRALTSWAAGGGKDQSQQQHRTPEHAAAWNAERQLVAHRRGVVMFLEERLQAAAALQVGMLETRRAREMEKNRSVLAKARQELPPELAREFGFAAAAAAGAGSSGVMALEEEGEQGGGRNRQAWGADLDITDEQRQMFERDNQDMLRHYNTATEKVKTVEKSLLEIAELQSVLVSNLSVQSANIEQLVADSEHTAENVGGGNKELKKAANRKFRPAQLTFYATCALCTFCVVWDLII